MTKTPAKKVDANFNEILFKTSLLSQSNMHYITKYTDTGCGKEAKYANFVSAYFLQMFSVL